MALLYLRRRFTEFRSRISLKYPRFDECPILNQWLNTDCIALVSPLTVCFPSSIVDGQVIAQIDRQEHHVSLLLVRHSDHGIRLFHTATAVEQEDAPDIAP